MHRKPVTRRPAEAATGEPDSGAVAGERERVLQLALEHAEAPEPAPAPASDSADEDPAESPSEDVASTPGPIDVSLQLAEYRRRVLANGADVQARRHLAGLLAARGELTVALEQYEAARELTPEDPSLVLELAETLIALKRFDPAERELRRLIKFQPSNGGAYLHLGIASFRRGLYAQAEQELQRATELLPDTASAYLASAYFYRGEALNQLSRLDEAMEMLQRTLQLDPGNGRAYYLMGILFDKKNLPHEAAPLYRKAREVGTR